MIFEFMKKKFKLHTFGCKTNKYESQLYIDSLLKFGYVQADEADFHIVNTCFVTKKVEAEVLSKVKQLLRQSKDSKIFVTGCAASVFKKNDQRIVIVPNSEKGNLLHLIEQEMSLLPRIHSFEGQTRAFIKVQDGCNNFCSYCVIPLVRGRSVSRSIYEIEEEIKGLVERGFKEVVLTGINIGDYNFDNFSLADLLKRISQIDNLKRIRISSIDPEHVRKNLIALFESHEKVCPSLHLSLQSGSDRILKRMNRNYSSDDFLSLVLELENRNKNFTFTTDVIVGFPGETEEDFEKTMMIVEKVNFAKVHIFPFSKREGTRAAAFEDIVGHKIISSRKDRLLKSSLKASFDLRQKFIGKSMRVLIEGKKKKGSFDFGHSENFLPILIKNGQLKRNEIIDVKIVSNSPECLIGESS